MEDFLKTHCVSSRHLLGSKIMRVRTNEGLSQKQLAYMIGISLSNLCRIEAGESNYNVDTLLSLCFCLNISLNLTL